MKSPGLRIRIPVLRLMALLAVAGCAKSSTFSGATVAPHSGVGAVRNGMSQDEVVAAMGQPEIKNHGAWIYSHQGIYASFDGKGVAYNIKCVSPFAGVTKEGIGIGATRAALLAAYGKPDQDQNFNGGEENLWFASLGMSFYLENGRITSFILH